MIKLTIETRDGKTYYEGKGLFGFLMQTDNEAEVFLISNHCNSANLIGVLADLAKETISGVAKEGMCQDLLEMYIALLYAKTLEWRK